MLKTTELVNQIKAARSLHQKVSKVLICIDSECTDIEKTRASVLPVQGQLRAAFPTLSIGYVVVDHCIEGWLMADTEALRQVLGADARVPRLSNPETNCRPAKLLGDIFRRNGRKYNKTTDPLHLADAANPTTISKASATFRAFQEALLGA